MITTCHDATYTIMDKPDRHTGNHIIKPTCVIDYCKNMGGVDVADQMLQYYEALRRTVKWWKKLLFSFVKFDGFELVQTLPEVWQPTCQTLIPEVRISIGQ